MCIETNGFLLDMEILLCLTVLFRVRPCCTENGRNIETVPGKKKIWNHSRSWTQNVMVVLDA